MEYPPLCCTQIQSSFFFLPTIAVLFLSNYRVTVQSTAFQYFLLHSWYLFYTGIFYLLATVTLLYTAVATLYYILQCTVCLFYHYNCRRIANTVKNTVPKKETIEEIARTEAVCQYALEVTSHATLANQWEQEAQVPIKMYYFPCKRFLYIWL